MKFTVRINKPRAGIPLEKLVVDNENFKQMVHSKQVFYVLSFNLDGKKVSKLGICQDAFGRNANYGYLRGYVIKYGLTIDGGCHGVYCHFIATTNIESQSEDKRTANRYTKSNLVRLEKALKDYYKNSTASMIAETRGEERVHESPEQVIKRVMAYKQKLPNKAKDDAPIRKQPSRKVKQKRKETAQKSTNISKKTESKEPEVPTYVIEKIIGEKAYYWLIKWKDYDDPKDYTWEPKSSIRRQLSKQVYKDLVRDYKEDRINQIKN
jgi:hypothetical protein